MSTRPPSGWRITLTWLSRGLAAFGLLIVCLLLVVLVSLPTLVKSAANQWLPALVQQITGIEVSWQIKTLQWHQLELDYLTARLADGTTLALLDGSLQYDSLGLLGGQLEQLRIRELHIVFGSTSTRLAAAQANSTEAAARAQLDNEWIELPALNQLLTNLPIKDISIETLQLDHPLLQARLAVELNAQHWQLLGQLTPFPATQITADVPPAPPWNLNLQLLANGQILAQISDQSTLLAHWFIQLQQDATTTRAELRQVLILPELSRQAYRLPPEIRQMFTAHPVLATLDTLESTATLTVNNRFRLPQDLQLEAVTRLTMAPGKHLIRRDLPELQIETLATANTLSRQWQLKLQHQQDAWHSQLSGPAIRLQLPNQTLDIGPWEAEIQCNPLLSQCHASASPTLRFQQDQDQQHLDGTANLPLQLDWNRVSTTDQPMLTAQIQLAAQGNLRSAAITSAWDITSRLQLTLNRTGPLTLHLDDTAFNASPQPIAQWRVAVLHIRQSGRFSATWDSNQLETPFTPLSELAFDLDPLTLQQPERIIRTGASQLRCTVDLVQPLCQLRLLLRPSQWQQWPLPDARLSADIRYNVATTQLTANPEIRLGNGELQLRSQLQHQLESGAGSWQFQLLNSSIVWNKLGLNSMPDLTGVDILSGELSGQGWVDWNLEQQRVQPDIMLRGDNISLVYDNRITLDNWQFLMALRPGSEGNYQINSQVGGDTLNTGVEMTDLLARADVTLAHDFSWASADIRELHTRLLGGRIYIPAVMYDSRKEINAFGIAIDQLQLASLAKLEPSAELEADGLLDGVLPIVLTQQGPSIPGGNLFARAPGGTIRYQTDASEALKQSDPSVALAMQLLENFHFKELSSGVRYQPDGSLNLSLKFEGNNPDFFNGQATHLNVNLEYNLLDLLSSLRVADDVINRLEQKYQ